VILYEYQAKEIFKKYGIPVPEGIVSSVEEDIKDNYFNISKGNGAILKSQLPFGGRGKSGGVKIVKSVDEALRTFNQLLGMNIKGSKVTKVLLEELVDVRREYYLGITIDPTFYQPALLISSQGGMDIEAITQNHPSALEQYKINPRYGIPSYEVLNLMKSLGLPVHLRLQFVDLIKKLYQVFLDHDAIFTEINPLVETQQAQLMAVDGRLNVDDNGLFKHPDLLKLKNELAETKEILMRNHGIEFVYLGGDIGLICAGAGMTMATMDLVNSMGGKPACFCDVSGGINPASMELALRTVSSLEGVKVLLVNMFGGVTRMDEVANSFIAAWEHMGGRLLPIVIRLEGTNLEEGRRIMRNHGFEICTNLYDAIRKTVDLRS
jgi:succinyl-CoA synthetase beta subunit